WRSVSVHFSCLTSDFYPLYLLPFFMLTSSHHHTHLHSLPTRRSSDLDSESTSIAVVPGLRVPGSMTWSGIVMRMSERPPPSMPRERKSTRLNSSHVSISYVVFFFLKIIKINYTTCSIYQSLIMFNMCS